MRLEPNTRPGIGLKGKKRKLPTNTTTIRSDLPPIRKMGWTNLVRHYRPRDWRDPRLEIRPSLIHGKGLIAVRPIKRGEGGIIFGGKLFSPEDIVAGKASTRTLMQIGEESW